MLNKYDRGASKDVYKILTGDEPKSTRRAKFNKSCSRKKHFEENGRKKTSHVATVSLVERKTLNSEWDTTICLLEVLA